MEERKREDLPDPDDDLLLVREAEEPEWHVLAVHGADHPPRGWALCGQWPSSSRGWPLSQPLQADAFVHDTCRFWAGMSGRWVYVRIVGNREWHVAADNSSDNTSALTMCGLRPGLDGWIASALNPAALELHPACRVLRDQRERN